MSRYFEEIERDLVEAAARRRRRRPRGSTALSLAAALVLAIGGTAGGTTYYVLTASPIAPFDEEHTTPEQRVTPGTGRVLELRAPDPSGDAPPWALRLARSTTGQLCGTVGQVHDDRFGIVGLDDRFRELPEANADSCGQEVDGDVSLLGVRVFDAEEPDDVVTVLNGVAGADLAEVRVALRGQRARALDHSAEGAFLAAFRGYPEDVQPVVQLRYEDGTHRRYPFAEDPFVVPDPLGGTAWKLEAFGFGSPVGERPPRYMVTCVRFIKAREQERNVSSSPVCGLQPARPGVPDRHVWFAARRLAGNAQGDFLIDGRWNGHPPRTAVYGHATVARSITVRAPGLTRTVEPTVNGAFLVVLDPKVEPTSVRVEVTGKDGRVRRYGHEHGTRPIEVTP